MINIVLDDDEIKDIKDNLDLIRKKYKLNFKNHDITSEVINDDAFLEAADDFINDLVFLQINYPLENGMIDNVRDMEFVDKAQDQIYNEEVPIKFWMMLKLLSYANWLNERKANWPNIPQILLVEDSIVDFYLLFGISCLEDDKLISSKQANWARKHLKKIMKNIDYYANEANQLYYEKQVKFLKKLNYSENKIRGSIENDILINGSLIGKEIVTKVNDEIIKWYKRGLFVVMMSLTIFS